MSRYLLALAVMLPAALLLVSQPLVQPTVSVSTVPSPDYAYPGGETTVRVELLSDSLDSTGSLRGCSSSSRRTRRSWHWRSSAQSWLKTLENS